MSYQSISNSRAFWWLLLFILSVVSALSFSSPAIVTAAFVLETISFYMLLNASPEAIKSVRKAKAIEPVKIDGRTREEWFDIIKSLGREEFESLSRPALDGLEESKAGVGGWDVEPLLGYELYHKLRREFYPEKYCEFCQNFTDGIPGNCMWDGPCHGYLQQRVPKEYSDKEAEYLAKEAELRVCDLCLEVGHGAIDCSGPIVFWAPVHQIREIRKIEKVAEWGYNAREVQ